MTVPGRLENYAIRIRTSPIGPRRLCWSRRRLQTRRMSRLVSKPAAIATNHLDLAAPEALAVALNEFEGSVMLVSHDRALRRAVCNSSPRAAPSPSTVNWTITNSSCATNPVACASRLWESRRPSFEIPRGGRRVASTFERHWHIRKRPTASDRQASCRSQHSRTKCRLQRGYGPPPPEEICKNRPKYDGEPDEKEYCLQG